MKNKVCNALLILRKQASKVSSLFHHAVTTQSPHEYQHFPLFTHGRSKAQSEYLRASAGFHFGGPQNPAWPLANRGVHDTRTRVVYSLQ